MLWKDGVDSGRENVHQKRHYDYYKQHSRPTRVQRPGGICAEAFAKKWDKVPKFTKSLRFSRLAARIAAMPANPSR